MGSAPRIPRWFLAVLGLAVVSLLAGCAAPRMEFVRVAPDHKGFILTPSNQPFVPWGHNYGVNAPGESGEMDWPRISRDFDDLRRMRANVARVHLQVPHYMDAADKPNARALAELSQLLRLAEQKGMRLDVTGLASYHIAHRAAWYDALTDRDRWAAQARFWEAVSRTCAKSPAVFCYDLMNEPVAGGQRKDGWYAGRMGDYEFVQRLSLDQGDHPQAEICREWTHLMVCAIHKHDQAHPITLGMLPAWGPRPDVVGHELDFIAVHIYPSAGKVTEALKNLKEFDIGKPIVVEETFPLSCGSATNGIFSCNPAASPPAGLVNTPTKPPINSWPCGAPARSPRARPSISRGSNSSASSAPRCSAPG